MQQSAMQRFVIAGKFAATFIGMLSRISTQSSIHHVDSHPRFRPYYLDF